MLGQVLDVAAVQQRALHVSSPEQPAHVSVVKALIGGVQVQGGVTVEVVVPAVPECSSSLKHEQKGVAGAHVRQLHAAYAQLLLSPAVRLLAQELFSALRWFARCTHSTAIEHRSAAWSLALTAWDAGHWLLTCGC